MGGVTEEQRKGVDKGWKDGRKEVKGGKGKGR
jgi:hypothetical protein